MFLASSSEASVEEVEATAANRARDLQRLVAEFIPAMDGSEEEEEEEEG